MELPKLSLREWEDTRLYLQLVCQIVGKTRLKLHPPLNQWWHVTLYLCSRGLTTGGIPTSRGELDITVDLVSHQVVLRVAGAQEELPIGSAICEFYWAYLQAMEGLGVPVDIDGKPYKCKSIVPFAEDRQHSLYDPEAAEKAFTALAAIEHPFKEFRGRFMGKCSPVHFFWHSFDLACTRFSGRPAPPFESDRVTMAAYSHEVISAGFWFGDDNVPEAAFYSYTAPSPPSIERESLPIGAEWQSQNGSPMALLPYESVRQASDPRQKVLEFLQSSYEAGARLSGWNRSELEVSGSYRQLMSPTL